MIRLFFLLAFLIGFQPVNPEEPVLRTHAHNDYLHEHPLYDALSYGFLSVEADILLHENKLYVGHDQIDLRNKSLVTLEDLYLNPLFERFKKNGGTLYPNYPGIFYLWIDIKYDGKEVIKILNNLIDPYREMLYSTTDNPGGKVQLIISGDRPYDLILNDLHSYLFLDGRPKDLDGNYSSEKMPFISQNIHQICQINNQGNLEADEFSKLRAMVKECHRQHKQVRFWATPDNEVMWQQLVDANVDLINSDDLAGLSDFLRKT